MTGHGSPLQVLIASWSHLLPAIGPGDQRAHATQRRILGQMALVRSTALNVGVGLLWIGGALGVPIVATVGGAAVLASVLGAVALAVAAVLSGLRSGTRPAVPAVERN